MNLIENLRNAKSKIIIVGINPLVSFFENEVKILSDLLQLNHELELHIYYESDTENFNQSLFSDHTSVKNRTTYSQMKQYKERICGGEKGNLNEGLVGDINSYVIDDNLKQSIKERVFLSQLNLQKKSNLIVVDDNLWYSVPSVEVGDYNDYELVEKNSIMEKKLSEYIEYISSSSKGGIFLSSPGQELIEMYDIQGYPRGIYPRKAFYTTKFQRYSIWGLVFNRKGELLLHKRSANTKDNSLLWDKSAGGHVDLRDSSTAITAKRELVEELFLPEAEFTKYVRADLGDIIDFGEWNIKKRLERNYKSAFKGLNEADWIMFRATDFLDGKPLTVNRTSLRRMKSDGDIVKKKTRFISDVFLYIAPENYLDTHDQMKDLVSLAEKTGAAEDHKIISIQDLSEWILTEENEACEDTVFTDDLLYLNVEYKWLLEEFSEFIKYIFK